MPRQCSQGVSPMPKIVYRPAVERQLEFDTDPLQSRRQRLVIFLLNLDDRDSSTRAPLLISDVVDRVVGHRLLHLQDMSLPGCA